MKMEWVVYGKKKPKSGQYVWVVRKGTTRPILKRYSPAWGGMQAEWLGNTSRICQSNDLWLAPEVPALPKR